LAQTSPGVQEESSKQITVRILLVLVWLYIFLLAVTLMGSAFKLFGEGFSKALLKYTSNPVTGLFIGILATSIVQSSSTVTSTIVAMVASDTLMVRNAIPIVMGCNIGTSVTNILVAMGFFRRRQEFGRAIAGATVHDFFNVLVTVILFPLEMVFRPLEHAATGLAAVFSHAGGSAGSYTFTSPVKAVVGPPSKLVESMVRDAFGCGNTLAGIIVLVISGVLLFIALVNLTKTMKSVMMGRLAVVFNRTLKRGGVIGIIVGMLATAVVQSSSVTTSLLVPLVAAGLIDVVQVFPLTLGANIGTTVTALLAALTGSFGGLVVAFTHVLFNLFGVLMVYPTPLRRIPILLACKMGEVSTRSRRFPIIYVIVAFFIIPIVVILVMSRLS
jgi:sodium-dependent phosphate cotransporter